MSKASCKSPLYIQLRELIRSKIEEGEYQPGTAIPSESTLSENYGISRLSVRSAVRALENEGLLTCIQGKGVFVSGPRLTRDLDTLGGFRSTMREKGREACTRILVKAQREAGPYYGALLGLPYDCSIWYVQRIDCSDSIPVALEEIYIPCDIIPNFEDMDIGVFSIYDAYCWNGHQPALCEQKLMIAPADRTRAKHLGISEGQAVMQFSYLTRDGEGRIIEFARNYVRGDLTEFTVRYKHT